MKYKITINEMWEIEGQNYPKNETVYEQVVEKLDVPDLVKYINDQGDKKSQ